MKAYLKKDPSRVGTVAHVYTTDYGQKRFTVEFDAGEERYNVIDAGASEFEVLGFKDEVVEEYLPEGGNND